jgi:nitrate reductase gamma subunit
MRKPLPFREAEILILRNMRLYSPIDPNLGALLGINQGAAIVITYAGHIAGFLAVIGSISLLTEPLLTVASSSSKLIFVAALLAAFMLGQSTTSYVSYRFCFRRWPARA